MSLAARVQPCTWGQKAWQLAAPPPLTTPRYLPGPHRTARHKAFPGTGTAEHTPTTANVWLFLNTVASSYLVLFLSLSDQELI